MTKGNYDVSETATTSPNDTSFRNCICAVLLFLGMCILIVLMAVLVPSRLASKSGGSESGALEGNGFKTTTPRRPSIVHTLRPTDSPWRPPIERTEMIATTTAINKDTENVTVTGTPDRKQPLLYPPKSEEDSTVSSTLATTITADESSVATSREATTINVVEAKTDRYVPNIETRFGGGTPENVTTTLTDASVTSGVEATTSSMLQNETVTKKPVVGTKVGESVTTDATVTTVSDKTVMGVRLGENVTTDASVTSGVEATTSSMLQNKTVTKKPVVGTKVGESMTTDATATTASDKTVIGVRLGENVTTDASVTSGDEATTSSVLQNKTVTKKPVVGTKVGESVTTDATVTTVSDKTVIGVRLGENVTTDASVTSGDEATTSSVLQNKTVTKKPVVGTKIGESVTTDATVTTVSDKTVIGVRLGENVTTDASVTSGVEATTSSMLQNKTVTKKPVVGTKVGESMTTDATVTTVSDKTVIGVRFGKNVTTDASVTSGVEATTSSVLQNETVTNKTVIGTKISENMTTDTSATTSIESTTSSLLQNETGGNQTVIGTKMNENVTTTSTDDSVLMSNESTTTELVQSTTDSEVAVKTTQLNDVISGNTTTTESAELSTADQIVDDATIITGTPRQATTPSSRNQVTDTIILAKRSYQSTTEPTTQYEDVASEFDGAMISNNPDESTSMDTVGSVTHTKTNLSTECATDTCKLTVSSMLGLMDHRSDGCEYFYQYSCGDNSNPDRIEPKSDVWRFYRNIMGKINENTRESFLRKFQEFYTSCINHEKSFHYRLRLETVTEVVKSAGDFIFDPATVVNKTTLTKLFAKLVLLKSFPLMRVNIDVDRKTSKYILQLSLPDRNFNAGIMDDWPTFLADERRCLQQGFNIKDGQVDLAETYTDYLQCRNNPQSYGQAVENVLSEIDLSVNADFNITILYDLDKGMMTFLNNHAQTANANADDNEIVTISALQQRWTILDWRVFFEELTGTSVPDDMTIEITSSKTLNAIMKKFRRYWMSRPNELYKLFLIIYATDVYQNTVLPKRRDDRVDYCLELSNYLFHDVSSFAYLEATNNDKQLRHYSETFRKISDILKANLGTNINDAHWLDADESVLLSMKLNNLTITTANLSSDCLASAVLAAKYDDVQTMQNFTWDLLTFMETKQRNLFALAGKDFQESDMFCYFIHPYEIRPKTFYGSHTIAVPYGLMTSSAVPSYILMAQVGIHLAQAIAKHFDPIGINTRTDLSEATKKAYRDKFIGETTFDKPSTVDGQAVPFSKPDATMTNQEIVDSAALKMVTETYAKLLDNKEMPWINENFTKEQIFFITIAQEFCRKTGVMDYMLHIYDYRVLPPQLRVDAMFMNSERFLTSFDCAEGSNMDFVVNPIQFPAYHEPSK